MVNFQYFSGPDKYRTVEQLDIKTYDRRDEKFTFAYSEKLQLIPKRSKMWLYPLDEYSFKVPVFTNPEIAFDVIQIVNWTNLQFGCDPKISELTNQGLNKYLKENDKSKTGIFKPNIMLDFTLERKLTLTVAFFAIVFAISTYLYLVIVHVNQIATLVGSIAGFFFSVWSTRGIIVQNTDAFPTLFDIIIFYLSIIFLVSILTKLGFGYYKKEES